MDESRTYIRGPDAKEDALTAARRLVANGQRDEAAGVKGAHPVSALIGVMLLFGTEGGDPVSVGQAKTAALGWCDERRCLPTWENMGQYLDELGRQALDRNDAPGT